MKFVDLAKLSEKFIADNSPTILTTIGVAGTVSTAILTGKASLIAARHLDSCDINEDGSELTVKQKTQEIWKLYIPAVCVGTIAVTSIILANRIGSRRAAAIATAYTISEKAFSDYKSKVMEVVGDKTEQAIRDNLAQDEVAQNPPSNQVLMLGSGDVLCYETLTGRYFQSTMETLKQAENSINYQILNDGYASLTDFYNLLGLARTNLSEELGWNLDKLLELRFSSVLSENNQPCLSIEFSTAPIRNYYKLR